MLFRSGIIRSQYEALDLSGLADGAEVFGGNVYPWGGLVGSLPYSQYQLNAMLELDETLLPFGDQAASARIYAQTAAEEELLLAEWSGNAAKLEQVLPLAVDEEVRIFGEVLGKSGMTYIYPVCRLWNVGGSYIDEDTAPWQSLRIVGAKGQELKIEREESYVQ